MSSSNNGVVLAIPEIPHSYTVCKKTYCKKNSTETNIVLALYISTAIWIISLIELCCFMLVISYNPTQYETICPVVLFIHIMFYVFGINIFVFVYRRKQREQREQRTQTSQLEKDKLFI